jgi:hypothetical protein
MRTVVKLVAFIPMLFADGLAQAEVVKRMMPACVTKELFDEFTTYATKSDKRGMAQLMLSGKCTILQQGDQISVISPGFMIATVRYKGVKLFAASEAVR